MAVSRGKFLKSLGKSIPGMVLGGGITTAAQKVLGKVAAVSGEPAIPSAPADPATVKVEPVEFIKQGPAEGNRIALTFDDGPTPGVTDLILDELKQRGLRATFFMIGNGITAAPDLARRVLVEGHEVGNHTLTHPKLTALPDAQVEAEVDKTQEIIRDVLRTSPAPIPIVGEPGTAVLFHCQIVHASGHNLSANDRWHVYMAYNPSANRPNPVPANPRPDYVVSRNYTPLVQTEDDSLHERVHA